MQSKWIQNMEIPDPKMELPIIDIVRKIYNIQIAIENLILYRMPPIIRICTHMAAIPLRRWLDYWARRPLPSIRRPEKMTSVTCVGIFDYIYQKMSQRSKNYLRLAVNQSGDRAEMMLPSSMNGFKILTAFVRFARSDLIKSNGSCGSWRRGELSQ